MTRTRVGYFLSSEEHPPAELVRQARLAEAAGFESLWISDHYHPWNGAQGHSPFVWSVIGALSSVCSLPVTTAVTCPTVRIHPAVVAQAAATSAVLLEGRFTLGVGSGEALNEHVTGAGWPGAGERLDMLTEAITVMRELWTGRLVDHRGTHYRVSGARLYTRPDTPPPVHVSAYGPRAVRLAARVGDGLVSTVPDRGLVEAFRAAGGAGKPAQAGYKVCYGQDQRAAVRLAHRLWASTLLPGELPQVLALPRHVEAASALVTEEMVAGAVVCGDDVDRHVARLREFADAGYDTVHVGQIGPTSEAFFGFYSERVLPRLRRPGRA